MKADRVLSVVAALLMLAVPFAWGVGSGGFHNEVVGAATLARGNAGVAAPDNAASIYFNPAHLAGFEAPAVTVGFTWERLHTEMTDAARGISEDMEDIDAIAPHGAFAIPINEQVAVGMGVAVPFGLETEWSETGFSRYVATKSEAMFVDIFPEIACKVSDRLAIGAGIDYFLGDANLKRQFNNAGFHAAATGGMVPLADGSVETDVDGDGWGINLGARFEPAEGHAIGIAWRSSAEVELDGSIALSGLSGASAAAFGGASFRADASGEIELPQTLTVGYAWEPDPRWLFEIDVQWTEWSSFDELAFAFDPAHPVLMAQSVVPKYWDDTWALGLGGAYQWSESWVFRAGYYFYETPVPDATFDTIVPDADRHNLSAGAGYQWDSSTIDFGYVMVLPCDRTVSNAVGAEVGASVNGEYESMHHLLAVSYSYAF